MKVFGRWEARSTSDATVEPPANVNWNQGAKIPDERRASIGQRDWAARLMPAQLMELMRHETIETTLSYYVGRNAERTAAILWHEHEKATESERKAEPKKPRGKRGKTST